MNIFLIISLTEQNRCNAFLFLHFFSSRIWEYIRYTYMHLCIYINIILFLSIQTRQPLVELFAFDSFL